MKKKAAILVFPVLLIVLGATLILTPRKTKRLVSNKFPSANVILILIDTLRADHLGCYGYGRNTSPVIDSLAQSGIRFSNMLAQASWTRPGTASILTGLYPKNHCAINQKDTLAEEIRLLPEILQQHGYTCYGFVPNGNAGEHVGFNQGYKIFSSCWVDWESRGHHQIKSHLVNRHVFKTIEQIERPVGNFIYVHYVDPHSPYAPVEKHWSTTEVRTYAQKPLPKGPNEKPVDGKEALREMINAYDDEILYNDKMIGRLLDVLKRKKMFSNSIIIVVSDHGEEFLDHHGVDHGKTLFEEQLRVPLIIRLPDRTTMELDKIANQVDILPTVLGLLDIPIPENIDGFDLFTSRQRRYSYSELDWKSRRLTAIQSADSKLIRGLHPCFGWFKRSVVLETDDHYLALKIKSSYVYRRIHILEDGKKIHELKITPRKKTYYVKLGAAGKRRRLLVKSAKPPPLPDDPRLPYHKKYHAFYLYNSENIKDRHIKGEPYDGFFSLSDDPEEKTNLFTDISVKNQIKHLEKLMRQYMLEKKNFNLTRKPIKMDEQLRKNLEALGYI